MKNFWNKIMISGVLATSILVTGAVAANINITVDGQYINFTDARPFISNEGRTLVPLRALAEGLNAKVGWNTAQQLVTVEKVFDSAVECKGKQYRVGKGNIEFRINDRNVKYGFEGILANDYSGNYNQDNLSENLTMDTQPVILEGRTYLPARYVANLCGYEVGWDQANSTVVCKDIDKIDTSDFSGSLFNPQDDVSEKKTISRLEELKIGDLVLMDTATSLEGKVLYYSEYQDENPYAYNVIDIRDMSIQEQAVMQTKSAGIAFKVENIDYFGGTIKIKADLDVDVFDVANGVEVGNVAYKNKLIELDGSYLDKLIAIDSANRILEFAR